MKNNNGITLIALVVTIIILLILAGVTLGTVLSDGGLIDKTKEAISEHKSAQEKEQEELGEAAGMMKNLIDGLRSTGGTTPVTPPPTTTGGTGSSEIAEDLKEYQGKYVDIGLDVTGTTETTDDWEIFYATNDRIFLIAADYVPTSKLTEWKVLESGTLNDNGFKKSGSSYPYNVYWPSYPTNFLTLPTEPNNFLGLVMHNGYSLETNHNNSKAASHLLNTDSWKGIKEAAEKSDSIEFVIGGPTLEMWCAAWKEAIKEDTNGFVEIKPEGTNDKGYYVSSDKSGMQNKYYLYMNGTQDELDSAKLNTLSTTYKTFFPHTAVEQNCYGYWLASPSANNLNYLMIVYCDGFVNSYSVRNYFFYGVRPVVSLQSGVQITETAEGSNIYNVSR